MDRTDYHKIPSVERLSQKLEAESDLHPKIIRKAVRRLLENLKSESQKEFLQEMTEEKLCDTIRTQLISEKNKGLKRVINATGIILHTNLGRAPLGKKLLEEMAEELSGYSNLEWDLEKQVRGSRTAKIESLFSRLLGRDTGVVVVNNNAAALVLVLSEFAKGKEVLVSRGELVQIGGGFRVPELMAGCGCLLKEVGATNITNLKDYSQNISEKTAFLMKVHESNFYQVGHTEKVSLNDLIQLSQESKIPLVYDLGAGRLLNSDGFVEEPSVERLLAQGVDILTISCDKLLGGPQGGVIFCDKELAAKLKKNPLYRALRLGKLDLHALEFRLREKMSGLPSVVDTFANVSLEKIESRAKQMQDSLKSRGVVSKIVSGQSAVGGGSIPDSAIPTWLLEIPHADAKGIYKQLSALTVPIVVRIQDNAVRLDLRTVFEYEDEAVVNGLLEVLL